MCGPELNQRGTLRSTVDTRCDVEKLIERFGDEGVNKGDTVEAILNYPEIAQLAIKEQNAPST